MEINVGLQLELGSLRAKRNNECYGHNARQDPLSILSSRNLTQRTPPYQKYYVIQVLGIRYSYSMSA